MGLDEVRSVEDAIAVVEDVVAAGTGAADGEFCFDDDMRALTNDELSDAFRLFECSRRDLLAVTRDLSDATLDWRPPPSAMARMDPWNPGVRTIREIVAEIASAEAYYRTALREGAAPPDDSPDELCDPSLQRRRLIDALGALPADDRGRVFMPVRSRQTAPEHWTARKVVRRVIAHERFHTAEIRQRLTWILLGVPNFGA
jgi:hypothetical protein